MDRIAFSDEFTTAEKRVFNNWRLFFKVSMLSDIVESNGNVVQSVYWNPQDIQSRRVAKRLRTSRHNWPHKQAPDLSTFKIWKRLLKQSFKISSAGVLHKGLGMWEVSPEYSENIWSAYLHTRNHQLYVRHNNISFLVHSEISIIIYHNCHSGDEIC